MIPNEPLRALIWGLLIKEIAIYLVGKSAHIPGLKKGHSVAGESEHVASSSKEELKPVGGGP